MGWERGWYRMKLGVVLDLVYLIRDLEACLDRMLFLES